MKTKKIHRVSEFNQLQLLKPYIEFNKHKKLVVEKNGGKDGKALYKLMNDVVYRKTKENLRNRIDIKLVNNEKDFYIKIYVKAKLYFTKILNNNLVALRKSKVRA